MSDFDTLWKFEAIKIATKEYIELYGPPLDLAYIFKRGFEIYGEGTLHEIKKWSAGNEDTESIEKEKTRVDIEKEAEELRKKALKKCPNCGDLIPIGWINHLKRTNGEECGYKFEK